MLCVGTNWHAANVAMCRKSHVSVVHIGINDAPALTAAAFGGSHDVAIVTLNCATWNIVYTGAHGP